MKGEMNPEEVFSLWLVILYIGIIWFCALDGRCFKIMFKVLVTIGNISTGILLGAFLFLCLWFIIGVIVVAIEGFKEGVV